MDAMHWADFERCEHGIDGRPASGSVRVVRHGGATAGVSDDLGSDSATDASTTADDPVAMATQRPWASCTLLSRWNLRRPAFTTVVSAESRPDSTGRRNRSCRSMAEQRCLSSSMLIVAAPIDVSPIAKITAPCTNPCGF